MEIKRKVELSVITNRRYVVRQAAETNADCAKCGEPMLTAEQTTAFFRVSQRRIFQIIEKDAAHYSENEAGRAMICLTSLAEFISKEPSHKRHETVIAD